MIYFVKLLYLAGGHGDIPFSRWSNSDETMCNATSHVRKVSMSPKLGNAGKTKFPQCFGAYPRLQLSLADTAVIYCREQWKLDGELPQFGI
jgi:hypothetical protein